MRPPKQMVVSAIEKAARDVARLQTRRLKLLRQLDELNGQLGIARRLLRNLVSDQVPDPQPDHPAAGGPLP